MADYQQTDTSAEIGLNCVVGTPTGQWLISAGAVAGTASHSAVIASAGVAGTYAISVKTTDGIPGTATWVGACTMRINVTTANGNITWFSLRACEDCPGAGASGTAITTTSSLGISLGTTGVKTASVEISTAHTLIGCTTATAALTLAPRFSSAATMSATFNYRTDQVVTVPFTASAAPAPSAIFTLAQMNVGQ